jgi:hypothetical protein
MDQRPAGIPLAPDVDQRRVMRRRRLGIVFAVTCLVVFLLALAASTGAFGPLDKAAPPRDDRTPIQRARENCEADKTTEGDNGRSVSITLTKYAPNDDVLAVTCLFDALGLPDHVFTVVNETRALDGRQRGTWAGYSASWTYHPDQGLRMTIVEEVDQ